MVVRGKVTKITNFGVFVELEDDLEGLLHISELADHKVENPQDVVQAGDEIDVKILRVDISDRKIGLSKKRAEWSAEQREAAGEPKTIKQRRGGLHGAGEQTSGLIPSLPTKPPAVDPAAAEGDAAADDASAGDAKAEDGDASDAPESTTEEDKGGA
jgi:small subunit ribosomal protein S1